jgi:hypothetical protein
MFETTIASVSAFSQRHTCGHPMTKPTVRHFPKKSGSRPAMVGPHYAAAHHHLGDHPGEHRTVYAMFLDKAPMTRSSHRGEPPRRPLAM